MVFIQVLIVCFNRNQVGKDFVIVDKRYVVGCTDVCTGITLKSPRESSGIGLPVDIDLVRSQFSDSAWYNGKGRFFMYWVESFVEFK